MPRKIIWAIILTNLLILRRKNLLSYVIGDVNWPVPVLEDKIKKYQDPREADKLLEIQSELEEVSKIMTKNLDDVRSTFGTIGN